MRRTSARLAMATSAAALLAAGSGGAGAAATVAPSLRVATVSTTGDPDLVVVVPATVAAQAVPPSAFRVRQGGRVLRISANRITDEGLDVHVVLDTSAANTSLAAEQGAASDLLRNLPPQVRTATETSGGLVHAPQAGRVSALQTLAQVRSDPAATPFETSTTLTAIASSPTGDRSRILVLLTGCRPDTAPGFPALGRTLARGRQQLDVLAAGSPCGPALAAQARNSGGLGVTGTPPERLAEAVDTITYDILGQYRLTVRNAQSTSPLDVEMDYAGVHASTTVALAPAQAGASAVRVSEGNDRLLFKLLAGLSGIILIATAVGFVLLLRRRSHLLPA